MLPTELVPTVITKIEMHLSGEDKKQHIVDHLFMYASSGFIT
jgi:hypothetical protein